MCAVAFAVNNDAADPFRDMNMRNGICPNCEQYTICKRSKQMPIISAVSGYVMKYLSEIASGFCSYPEPGSWEKQPAWFMIMLDKAKAEQHRQEKLRQEREAKKHGN